MKAGSPLGRGCQSAIPVKVSAIRSLVVATALLLGLATAAQAQSASGPPIRIEGPWARATPGGARNGAAYLTIVNQGPADDRLVAISTPAAGTAALHQTMEEQGVMKMLPVPALDLKAGATVAFEPGGYHIMLMNLKAPLKEGQTFPLALTFEKAGRIEVTVKVGKAGAMGHDMGGMKTD